MSILKSMNVELSGMCGGSPMKEQRNNHRWTQNADKANPGVLIRVYLCLSVVPFLLSPLTAQSLRQLADQRGIKIGSAVDPSHFGESQYTTTLSREFSQVEPENAMKFGPIHPGPTT